MRNFDEFVEKIARTKVQKMVDTGKIKGAKTISKIFYERPEIKDTIHNKINAKAKRATGSAKKLGQDASRAKLSDVTPKPMTAIRYKRLSKTDSLKSAPAIDINRQLKDMGKENAHTVARLRTKYPVSVVHSKGNTYAYAGKTSAGYDMISSDNGLQTSNIAHQTVSLPEKGARIFATKKLSLQNKNLSREQRGGAARHEISGEAPSIDRIVDAFKKEGINPTGEQRNSFAFGSHWSPDVLVKDADTAKRLSPFYRAQDKAKRKDLPSYRQHAHINSGRPMSENQYMNVVRVYKNPANLSAKELNESFITKPHPDNKTRHVMLGRAAILNGQYRTADQVDYMPKVVHNIVSSSDNKHAWRKK